MTTDQLHVGIIQFDIQWENPEANIHAVENLLTGVHMPDIIMLPEMWSTGFSMRPELIAEKTPGTSLQWMIDQAHLHQVVITGSLSVEDNGQYYNRWYCVHPDGRVDHYDKRHLFSFGKEDEHYSPGTERSCIEIKGWKIKPLVCYDLRFPVWARNTEGYDLIMVAANWPTPRIQHWDILLKARAIENQCYVAAVNRIGTDGNGLSYPGHSAVYDMHGETLLLMDERPDMETITISKSTLDQYRSHFRFLQDMDRFNI